MSGCRKWINSTTPIRVENTPTFHESLDRKTSSYPTKTPWDMDEDDEEISSYSLTDSSALNHFDVQLQVNNGQPQRAIRYEVFTATMPNEINAFKTNQSSQTIEPEMDMDNNNNNDGRRNGNSRQNHGNHGEREHGGYRRNQSSNGSSSNNGGNADGNGSNPNRNNNNSRR